MPAPDPIPQRVAMKRRLLRIMRLGGLLSVIIAMIAVALIAKGDTSIRAHMLIVIALAVGIAVLLGIALMSLLFLGHRPSQRIKAANHRQKDENDPRP